MVVPYLQALTGSPLPVQIYRSKCYFLPLYEFKNLSR